MAEVERDFELWPTGDPEGAVQRLALLWDITDGELTDDEYRSAGYLRRLPAEDLSPPVMGPEPARRPGRPGWDPATFWRHYRDAEAATPEPRTEEDIADRFVRLDGTVGIDPDSLRRLRREHRGKASA